MLTERLERRFWAKVALPSGAHGCMEWLGWRLPNGYGVVGLGRRSEGKDYAHRVAYRLGAGAIPDGLEIDHLCRNRACVRVDHLEAVTRRENVRRGRSPAARNAAKTHCPRGHPYDEVNTYWRRGRHGRGCRTCNRERSSD